MGKIRLHEDIYEGIVEVVRKRIIETMPTDIQPSSVLDFESWVIGIVLHFLNIESHD